MVHHCDFFSKKGKPTLIFKDLVQKCLNGVKVDPLDFNRFMGKNIPEAGRLISIADVIDAIASRRVYHEAAGWDIEKTIDFIEKELIEKTGLVIINNQVDLNYDRWIIPVSPQEENPPYCIEWKNKKYIPKGKQHEDDKHPCIQFDPHMIAKLYRSGSLPDSIKNSIRANDRKYIPEKIKEVEGHIEQHTININSIRPDVSAIVLDTEIKNHHKMLHLIPMLQEIKNQYQLEKCV